MDNVVIDGGLDLVHARPATRPGFIRQCLNYEVGWARGLTRIDGFERFDGHVSPSNITGWVFDVLKADVTGTFSVPESLTWSNIQGTGDAGDLVAVEDQTTAWRFFLIFRRGTTRPLVGDTLTGNTSSATFDLADVVADSLKQIPEHYSTHAAYLTALGGFATTLRGQVQPVPGAGTVVGMHYHEDQLYAIRDTVEIGVATADADALPVNAYVYNTADQVARVLAVDTALETVTLVPVSAEGFTVVATDVLSIALSVRFNTGAGVFDKADTVLGDTSGWAGTVGYTEVRDGALASDTAVGVAVLMGVDTSPTVGETFDNGTSTGSMVVESILFGHDTDTLAVASVSTTSDSAALWRSTSSGWEPVSTGGYLRFVDGEADPDVIASVPFTDTYFGSTFSQETSSRQEPFTGTLSDLAATNANTIDTDTNWPDVIYTNMEFTSVLTVGGFKVDARASDVITGIQVEVVARDFEDNGMEVSAALVSLSPTTYEATMLGTTTLTSTFVPTYETLAEWGGKPVTPEVLLDTDFSLTVQVITGSPGIVNMDSVAVVVHGLRPAAGSLYLWDGTADVGVLDATATIVSTGSWSGGDATGYFRLRDWTATSIPAGTQVRTLAAGAGDLIAVVEGQVTPPTLPGSRLLAAENSRYQMMSYNFYASEAQAAVYGVSGAGPAFWFSEGALDFIFTGVDSELEKPRHIAPHENRLALGYGWGEVYLSGPDPLDFSADTGLAASFGFGDRLTGLSPAPGKALAVFTESSTFALIGAPEAFGLEALAYVEQQVINHSVGAIEYTVQNLGNSPMYASFRGIETLETMDRYSDFFTAPLTDAVTPWLLERLQAAVGQEATGKSVVASIVVRNKNQYRLFFADGYVLTLTQVGVDKDPQCTVQKYWFNGDQDEYVRCFATASGVTSDGRDRVFFSTEPRPVLPDTSPAADLECLDYVYELDRGPSFDGGAIDSSFTLTHYYSPDQNGQPNVSYAKRYSQFQMHGTGAGLADLWMARSVNYEDLDTPVLPYEPVPFGAGTEAPESEAGPKYTKGRVSARGFAISLHVKHASATEFPHTIQMVTFTGTKLLKQDW